MILIILVALEDKKETNYITQPLDWEFMVEVPVDFKKYYINMGNEENTKPNIKQAVPFLGVSNMEESLRYYVDGLGFEITHKWIPNGKIEWCWLQHGGAAVMLQEFRKEGNDSYVPSGNLGEGVSIFFICEDALVIYRELTSRGIQASEPLVGNNMWVTGLSDPDGYKLNFESNTDTPEETKYSEWYE